MVAFTIRRILAHIFICAALASSSAAQTNQGIPPGSLHVKPVKVMDPTGFEQPLPAFSIMIPQHWQSRGGITWGTDGPCNQMGYNFDWWATSPDGTQGIGVLPTLRWVSANGHSMMNPCPDLQIRTARDLLQQHVNRLMPSAQVIDYRQRPDYLKQVGVPESGSMHTPMPGGEMILNWDAGEVLIGYTSNGQEYRATLGAVAATWITRIFPAYGLPGIEISGGNSLPGFAAFAPAGQLDLQAVEALRTSIKLEPEWGRRIAEHEAKINKTNRDGQTEIARINRESNAEISRIIAEGTRSRNESWDRNQREVSEMIRGVETYADRNGGTVELDHTYNHAWQMDDGSYVLTNDIFFEPFRDLGVSGERLQPVQ